MGSATSPFIVDDAIVGLAQPLTEALNQLARGPRRACDVIKELGRREDFYLDHAGGSSRRIAGAVFHNAHLPYKLSCANRAEKDGIAIEFPEYVDGVVDTPQFGSMPRRASGTRRPLTRATRSPCATSARYTLRVTGWCRTTPRRASGGRRLRTRATRDPWH